MATLQLETYQDLYTAIAEALGVQTSDTPAVNKIKRLVNLYYLDEVVPFKRWTWLRKQTQAVQSAYYNVGTASVTPQSTTVTLSTAPNVSLGSFKDYKFSVDNSNAIYTVSAHTAGSTSITLTAAFQEALNATTNFKIWRDRVDLPSTAKETIQITHPQLSIPMRAVGPQEFSTQQAACPKGQGFPRIYSTDTFYDPSGTEGESDRYRQVRVYPSITDTPVALTIDYIEEATALVNDTDEPLVPLEDRSVIYYGAGAQAWSIISRNEEMAERWLQKAQAKLARMAGDIDDGYDAPKMTPDARYVNSQRGAGLRRRRYGVPLNGDSSVSLPTYLKSVTIAGGTLTANLNVNPGVLIGGVDLSSAIGVNSSVTLLDNVSSTPCATFSLATSTVVHLDYSINRNGVIEAGSLKLAATALAVNIAQGPYTTAPNGQSCGVTFSADISNGNIRLLYSTTSTGQSATLIFRTFKWLA